MAHEHGIALGSIERAVGLKRQRVAAQLGATFKQQRLAEKLLLWCDQADRGHEKPDAAGAGTELFGIPL